MTKEEIILKLKEWAHYDNGQDYYAYCGFSHWWLEQEDLDGFAEELLDLLNKDKSPTP